jgi:hypothetical protein
MASQASTCKAIQAVDVVMDIDGHDVHAIVTREAIEEAWGPVGPHQDHLLDAWRRHRPDIEAEIVRRYRAQPAAMLVIRDGALRGPQAKPAHASPSTLPATKDGFSSASGP